MQPEPFSMLAWLLDGAVLSPVAWLCEWPARFSRAYTEARLHEIFSPGGPATELPWLTRALRRVQLRAAQASGNRRL